MGHRLSAITTRTGDDGTTGLGDGSRILKSDMHIECIGDVDELNSSIGIIIAQINTLEENNKRNLSDVLFKLNQIQHDLFDLGGEICMPAGYELLKQSSLENLDIWIKSDNKLPRLKEFILPSGSLTAAHTHLSRCICRRAERHIIKLRQNFVLRDIIVYYLNRLSDWLFIISRVINQQLNYSDILWHR